MPAPVASRNCFTREGEIVAAQVQKRLSKSFLCILAIVCQQIEMCSELFAKEN